MTRRSGICLIIFDSIFFAVLCKLKRRKIVRQFTKVLKKLFKTLKNYLKLLVLCALLRNSLSLEKVTKEKESCSPQMYGTTALKQTQADLHAHRKKQLNLEFL